MESAGLTISGWDDDEETSVTLAPPEARVIELPDHPVLLGTLFVAPSQFDARETASADCGVRGADSSSLVKSDEWACSPKSEGSRVPCVLASIQETVYYAEPKHVYRRGSR